jgi:alkanesulfonate monooxygenase SsuD/methylene tetrahydromethanopterin reductase-like flavin-dependent oxidoreductase (luciferase family)
MRRGASLHLAAALDGAGWHPAAWRDPGARPGELFTAAYWADLAGEAERGLLDFVTIEDALGWPATPGGGISAGGRPGRVRGRLDAVLLAARVAPLTSRIGLVPAASTTHTEPFRLSTTIATLDYISSGRAGWRAQVSARPGDAAHFGRQASPGIRAGNPDEPDGPVTIRNLTDLLTEAADAVEVARRLWDSWEDDAVIRDAPAGRFVDRDKLHRIDFDGWWFSVKGPSVTPRPPQGQPVVTAQAHAARAYEFAARAADVVFVTPRDAGDARSIVDQVCAAEAAVGRSGEPLRVYADLVVFLDSEPGAAADRKSRLDDADGGEYAPDAAVFTGTPRQLADTMLAWQDAGIDGFRLRPGVLPRDLESITRGLVPVLHRCGAFRRGYESTTLRGHLGLPRPASRYAATPAPCTAAGAPAGAHRHAPHAPTEGEPWPAASSR